MPPKHSQQHAHVEETPLEMTPELEAHLAAQADLRTLLFKTEEMARVNVEALEVVGAQFILASHEKMINPPAYAAKTTTAAAKSNMCIVHIKQLTGNRAIHQFNASFNVDRTKTTVLDIKKLVAEEAERRDFVAYKAFAVGKQTLRYLGKDLPEKGPLTPPQPVPAPAALTVPATGRKNSSVAASAAAAAAAAAAPSATDALSNDVENSRAFTLSELEVPRNATLHLLITSV
eukprot:PhM_4_TR19087/c0_g1_i2/m.96411